MSFMPTSLKDDDYEPEFNVDELPTPTPEQRKKWHVDSLKNDIEMLRKMNPDFVHTYRGKEYKTQELITALEDELKQIAG
ncbi:MAG: hypothetical protein IK038_01070 [Bacteroidaceae bacterium]|nr:hypothetical protein [Bacteroidaceae bacterium]